jgi:SnoaL-like domain
MSGNRELVERFISSLEARDWDAWTGLLHPAVVYELPQSRERIRGRDRYLRFNQEYPGDWHLRPKVTLADERHGVAWFDWLHDGGTGDGMAFFEFTDGLITRVTDFWPESYEPPPGREHLVERWLPAPRSSSLRSPRAPACRDALHRPRGRLRCAEPPLPGEELRVELDSVRRRRQRSESAVADHAEVDLRFRRVVPRVLDAAHGPDRRRVTGVTTFLLGGDGWAEVDQMTWLFARRPAGPPWTRSAASGRWLSSRRRGSPR